MAWCKYTNITPNANWEFWYNSDTIEFTCFYSTNLDMPNQIKKTVDGGDSSDCDHGESDDDNPQPDDLLPSDDVDDDHDDHDEKKRDEVEQYENASDPDEFDDEFDDYVDWQGNTWADIDAQERANPSLEFDDEEWARQFEPFDDDQNVLKQDDRDRDRSDDSDDSNSKFDTDHGYTKRRGESSSDFNARVNAGDIGSYEING
jgi:hypothetical protein